jgi:hypothetical protein
VRGNLCGRSREQHTCSLNRLVAVATVKRRRGEMEGKWSLLELEEQVDKALDRCTRLELERRKAGGKSRDAHASMK